MPSISNITNQYAKLKQKGGASFFGIGDEKKNTQEQITPSPVEEPGVFDKLKNALLFGRYGNLGVVPFRLC